MVDARRNESGIVINGNQIDGQMSTGYPAVFVFANSFETPNVNLNDVLIENNTVSTTGTVAQVMIYNYSGTGTVTGVHAHNNSFPTGPAPFGLKSNTAATVDAINNWWGNSSGPYNATSNTLGTGAAVSDNVLFNPFNTLAPVELSSFTSTISGRNVQLNWETKTEKNSDKFVIEKMNSAIGSSWVNVGFVKAAVLSNSPKQYSFTDKNLQAGKYQYRLKMIDNDGSFEYSKIVETEVASPKNFELSQNYPNPFNPSTKINYQLPVDAKVLMEVYNIAGQKVIELVNQEQSAGYYTVDFGASKLSSGVYIYRLAASDKATGNNFSSIKKMMLLK
jgi:hypothetical protein